jgi:hypothetical protein
LQGVRCFKKWWCIIWFFSVFLTCNPVWLSADGVTDSDGDGFPDVVEKHWGSDPANENHVPDWEAEQVACWRLEAGIGSVVSEATGAVLAEGTFSGAVMPQWQREGDRNYLSFDGSHAEVQVPQLPANGSPTQLAIMAWIRASPAADGVVVGKWSSHGVRGSYTLALVDGHPAMELSLGGIYRPLVSPFVLPDDGWHHVAAVYDGFEMRLYLDGRRVATAHTGGRIDEVNAPLTMGQFRGGMSDVRLYRRSFGDGHMAAIYKFGQLERQLAKPEFMIDDLPQVGSVSPKHRVAGLDRPPRHTAAKTNAPEQLQAAADQP